MSLTEPRSMLPFPSLVSMPPNLMTAEPFGVYVHWPFCKAKCPYCDFNSHVRRDGIDEGRFLAGYLTELRHFSQRVPGRTVTSIFFGGGTPSLMAPRTVETILDAIAGHWTVAGDAEITLEANPTSVEAANFVGYAVAGVNRLSLGVQALDEADLKTLGRQHTVDEALGALALAKENFGRVSFDLIYARQGQSAAAWKEELTRALSHAADHLSLYQLTIEDGTPFAALHAAGRLRVPGDDSASDMYLLTQELCDKAGLPAYEISNHARPGSESRHNLVYWRGHDYAGIGPGAHARITLGPAWKPHPDPPPFRGRETKQRGNAILPPERGEQEGGQASPGTRHALATIKSPEEWLGQVEHRGHGLASDEPLSAQEAAEEYLLMALRLAEGLDLTRLEALSGRALDRSTLDGLEREGLLVPAGDRLKATPSGRLLLERLILELAA